MKADLLFLTLRTFSATGGIEKVCRLAGKALYERAAGQAMSLTVYSAYDASGNGDERYFPASIFKGFNGNRKRFVWQSLRRGRQASVVLLSHINLLPVGYAIKKISPATKLVLLAHGIEVWYPLPVWKKKMLQACDRILPVSRFTRGRIRELFGLNGNKLVVVNNCIDPFLPAQADETETTGLRRRYGLTDRHKLLLTITRLSEKERAKGYGQVMLAMKELKNEEPGLRYLLVGKYTSGEKAHLDRLRKELDLEQEVILAGFVPDGELAAHFSLADIFIMPSRKEGFGIVFIEALYYGKAVIAGNRDGSTDALANGKFGALVDPESPGEIRETIRKVLRNPKKYQPGQPEVLKHFGFETYSKELWQAVGPLCRGKDTVVSKQVSGF